MRPPLLKATAGRRKKQRFKGCSEGTSNKTRKKGQRKCPICKYYGHHWQNRKQGDPKDIANMMAVRGPPTKRKKATKAPTETSVVPFDDQSLSQCMTFPPSQSIEPANKKGEKVMHQILRQQSDQQVAPISSKHYQLSTLCLVTKQVVLVLPPSPKGRKGLEGRISQQRTRS